MAPMKRPADPRHSPYHGTWSLGKAARHFAMPKKQLRRLLGTGQLEFVQIEGQIRIPIEVATRFSAEAWSGTMATIKRAAIKSNSN